jgi:hypothetical protein
MSGFVDLTALPRTRRPMRRMSVRPSIPREGNFSFAGAR